MNPGEPNRTKQVLFAYVRPLGIIYVLGGLGQAGGPKGPLVLKLLRDSGRLAAEPVLALLQINMEVEPLLRLLSSI